MLTKLRKPHLAVSPPTIMQQFLESTRPAVTMTRACVFTGGLMFFGAHTAESCRGQALSDLLVDNFLLEAI